MRLAARFAALVALAAGTLSAQKPLVEGNASSPVRVVIYEDLQCPDCAAFRKNFDERILPRFRDSVAFEHRDFPLAKHAWARKAAIAGRFFINVSPEVGVEFRRTMFATQTEVTPENFDEHLRAFAKAHKVDPKRAIAALNDAALAAFVETEYQDGVARGIAHTPTVIVDGEPFVETFSIGDMIHSIEQALAASKK